MHNRAITVFLIWKLCLMVETAFANLLLNVEGAGAERDFDCEMNRDFALLDTAMELSDEITYLKSHVIDKIK